jgi:N-acetylglucosaminyldiphosphoundecaprenol N-acetyl-beta-D-mannosaminyltransferase
MEAASLPSVGRICVLGAARASNDRLVERLRRENPETSIYGIPGDPWEPAKFAAVAAEIADFEPDLLLVGLGMPLQEKICADLVDFGVSGVIATVGGAIDQLAGTQRSAPRWLGRFRVEWLWRLVTQPRRLAHRYLIEPLLLVGVLVDRRGRS